MLFLETIFVTLNLSAFATGVWNCLNTQETSLRKKILLFFSYFLFYALLNFILVTPSDFQIYFLLKKFFFGGKGILLFGLLFALFFILFRKKENIIWILSVPLFSWFLFFFLFSKEIFEIGSLKIRSINLFQVQNPILFCSFFLLIFLTKRVVTAILFLGVLSLQFGYSYYDRRNLEAKLPESFVYFKYSAAEFFLSGSFIIVEREKGIYEFLHKENLTEPIYKFTMKPLRYLNIYERQFIQRLVEEFEFPIVLRENDNIAVYEMLKSYKGILFRVEIDRFTLEGKVKGPKF